MRHSGMHLDWNGGIPLYLFVLAAFMRRQV
ncbi:hypothetical protein MESS2_110008 [Mesorhizobium metallidurans STM 2683]|uniref:Uncharacterized protein n=1 Tax=Mesorhizobium metallidurans STM 2683 TaxID=1297569 RepID=M5EHH6_9HYPH|nr:hypothetical protein MESS2_110008 [Mesorhizobium metallidurans STM 2683]